MLSFVNVSSNHRIVMLMMMMMMMMMMGEDRAALTELASDSPPQLLVWGSFHQRHIFGLIILFLIILII